MKTITMKLFTIGLTLATLAGLIAGCVSKGYDKGAATSTALQSSANKVTDVSQRVTDTLGALNGLTFNPQGDLRDQYGKFTAAVKNLQSASADLDVQVADVQAKAQAYSVNWSNQLATIQSPDIRSRSAARKDEVTAKLQNLNGSYQGVKDSLKSFLSDVTDIKTYLDTDLTAAGLDKIKDVVARTKVDAVPVRDSIKRLQADFSDASTALSPVLPARN
jgi:chromosome segregation ATPase